MDRGILLEFLCYIGAGLGLLAYGMSYLRDRTFTRVINSAGLFLTAAALILLPHALQIGAPGARVSAGWITALLLLAALWTQGAAALRQRKPRTGVREREADRRTPDARTRAGDRPGGEAA